MKIIYNQKHIPPFSLMSMSQRYFSVSQIFYDMSELVLSTLHQLSYPSHLDACCRNQFSFAP